MRGDHDDVGGREPKVLGAKTITNKTITKKGGKPVIPSPDENVFAVPKTAGIEQLMPIMFDRGAAHRSGAAVTGH